MNSEPVVIVSAARTPIGTVYHFLSHVVQVHAVFTLAFVFLLLILCETSVCSEYVETVVFYRKWTKLL